jgi:hypothetical protein
MAFSIRCPDCRQKFAWNPTEGMPEVCPNPQCSTRMASDRADDDIVMPFIRSNGKTAAADKVYRDMERGSEVRAQVAADMAGVPVAEMSGLKITNLNDRRDAPIKAIEVKNDISEAMTRHQGVTGMTGGAGVSLCADTVQGAYAGAGARTRTMIQSMHSEMVAKHAIGVDADTKRAVVATHNLVSDRPSKETEQPGYRRRG